MIRTIRKDNDELMEEIKSAWSDCYTIKLKANDLIDLYAQLVIYSTGHGPEVRKNTLKNTVMGTVRNPKFMNVFLNNSPYKITSTALLPERVIITTWKAKALISLKVGSN